tara:strand:- start:3049 stop:3627 length:579 start_codon:yes stop_codon:yes gene_type:complete
MALGLLGNGILGLSMVRHREDMLNGQFDAEVFGMPVFDAYQLHKSLGFVLLLVAVFRLVLSLLRQGPALPPKMPMWERRAAKTSHRALYMLMFLLPFSGWLMVSASPLGIPTLIFDVVELPPLVTPDADLEALSRALHIAIAATLAMLVVVHIAAALKHHFIDHDNVLRRMMPFAGRRSPVLTPDGSIGGEN